MTSNENAGPGAYDPEARRETPLATLIKAQIAAHGPMPVAAYVDLCLNHPHCGYYRTRSAIGRDGDFITAPEISQTFGELLGLWAIAVWQSMGAPDRLRLIELGPGRGTLMQDALRAARLAPAVLTAMQVTLIEPNPVLEAIQRRALHGSMHPAVDIRWQPALSPDLFDRPTILLANEVLDVLPVTQHLVVGGQLRDRTVSLSPAGQLIFSAHALGPFVERHTAHHWPDGTVLETPSVLDALAPLGHTRHPLAALWIDYGHPKTHPGDTLQAVRNHAFEHPLTSPGEADLSFQVDFEAVASQVSGLGLAIDGPITQAAFLGRLGIVERTHRLMAANPPRAHHLETATARLIAPHGMGGRFFALGARTPGLPPLPAF